MNPFECNICPLCKNKLTECTNHITNNIICKICHNYSIVIIDNVCIKQAVNINNFTINTYFYTPFYEGATHSSSDVMDGSMFFQVTNFIIINCETNFEQLIKRLNLLKTFK